MAVTRIKNNQITDSTVVASAKLVDYSITAAKIANNLTYGSDLTITGNLTVNGQTTTIDTVSTVIEDPVIVLASNQTGTPSVDIGFIGERGSSDNVAFVWDESADEFVTAFTTDLITNTTVTISSYSNFHTNDANIGGNIVINGTTSLVGNIISAVNVTGNVTGGNLLTPGVVTATGNVTGGNLVTAGQASVTGNVTGGNLNTAGQVVATGNVSGGNITTAGLTSTGSLTASTTIVATGNITGGNLNTAGQVVATGNVSGGNITTAGDVTTSTVTASSTVTATGNVSGGNINTAGQVVATGNITGGNLVTSGSLSAPSITATGNITGGNLLTSGLVNATGNVSGGNINTAGLTSTGSLTASTTIVATGNVSGGNINTAGQVVATGNVSGGNITTAGDVTTSTVTASTTIVATGNITGGNLITAGVTQTGTLDVSSTSTFTGNVTSAFNVTGNIAGGNILTPGLISATGNITGGNLIATANIYGSHLQTTGNAVIGGNLFVLGNITYNNVDDLRIQDPVIIMGTGPNGAPLTGPDSFDRGIYMEWYKTGLGNSWIGWQNSSGNLIAAADVAFSGNDVIQVNSYGTFQAGNLYIQSAVSTGNVTGGNLVTAGLVSATGNVTGGNLVTAGLTSTGTLSVSSTSTFTGNVTSAFNVTGNIAGGNLNTAGQVVATGNITGGNLITSGSMSVTGNINAGNLNAVNQVTASTGFFTGNVDVLGNLNATIGVVYANSGIFYGNAVTGNNAAFAGIPGFTPLGSNVVVQFAGNANSYSQLNFQNINNGTSASTDFIATADNGSDTTYYMDVGINSSTFNDPINYPGFGPNDSYVHNHGGNLILNPETTGKAINFMVGGTDTTDIIGYIDVNGLSVTGTIAATGNTSGGNLTTAGQVSATGNVSGGNINTAGLVSAGTTITATGNVTGGNVNTAGQVVATGNVSGGNVIATELVTGANVTASANVTGANVVGTTSGKFGNIVITGDDITDTNGRVNINTAGGDIDFAINGDTVANVFYVDAGTGTVSFGSSAQTTNAIAAFNTTNSILLPVGNTAQRPSTGVLGMLRYNSIDDALETYTSGGWETVGVPVFTVIADQQFNGDGSTVAFTLGSSQTTASCIVSINGVVQLPTVAYSVSGTTLTFTEAPLAGDVIDVRQITTTTTVVAISNTGGNAVVAPNSTAAQVDITGDLVPVANNVQSLGTTSLRWSNLWLSGSTLTLGNVVMKNVAGGNTVAFYGPDGTTPATIASSSVDTTQIQSGTSAMAVVTSGGNIRANIAGSTVALITSSGMQITGDLSVTGNATLSGNILGDRIQNGTTTIDIQTINGNANISIAGTSNVAVFSTAGANITGALGVTGNITGNYLFGNGSQLTGIDATSIQNGTSAMAVIASGGNIRANVGGATVGLFQSGGLDITGTLTATTALSTPSIVHTGSNAVGNIGSSSSYFNTVFAQATSALYADLAEKYVADAEYAPGTVVVFGGDKEVTVSSTDADRAVAGVVSTNPSYIMNGGLEAEFVSTVALTGRVPCRVTGTVRKGDLMVSAGYGLARAEQDPKVGTVIGKALENFEGNEGVIEVVVGRF